MSEKEKLEIAEEYFSTGYNLHLNGDLEGAILNYRRSIELFPLAKAHTFLGWAYSLLGDFDRAINECLLAIEIDPDFGNPYNDIGSYLIALNKDEEAVYWLERALDAKEYQPRHFPLYNLGIVYEKKGEWFLALEYYHESLKMKSDFTQAKLAILRITTLLN
jgi:Tfp pilus assembly protein PilF